MIKCPNCGSTAQVRKTGTIYNSNYKIEHYNCGCGHKFKITKREEEKK